MQLRQRKKPERQRDVMEQREEGTDAELPFEAKPDVECDPRHREQQADHAGIQQLFGYFARHGFNRINFCAGIRSLDRAGQL